MGALSIFLLVIFVITAILLIIIVLMQDEQGEGLGGLFGGGSTTPFGSRSGNVLTKTTSILGAIFLVTSLVLAWLNRTPERGDVSAAARQLEAEESEGIKWWDTDAVPESETLPEGEEEGAAVEPENTEEN
ncbi:MAG: preprotein translocase subunit SecG [Spirochaetia bacterium]